MNYTTVKKVDAKKKITKKENELIKDLYYLRYISREQIWKYYFSNSKTNDDNTQRHCRRRISVLVSSDILSEKILPNGKKVYRLTSFSYQVSTDLIAKEFRNDLEAIQFYSKKNSFSDLGMRSMFIPHLLETNEVYLQLKYKYAVKNWSWINSLDINRLEINEGNYIVPDAQIKFNSKGIEKIIHIETDMNTENIGKLKAKIGRYDKYSSIREKMLLIKNNNKKVMNNNYVMVAFKKNDENKRFIHRSTSLLEYTLDKVNLKSNINSRYDYSFGDTDYISNQIYLLIKDGKSMALNEFIDMCCKHDFKLHGEVLHNEVFTDDSENKETTPDLTFIKNDIKCVLYDLTFDSTKRITNILNAIDIGLRKSFYDDIYIICNSYSQFSQMLALTNFSSKPHYLLEGSVTRGFSLKIDTAQKEIKQVDIF